MAKYEKKIKKNIAKQDVKPLVDPTKKQIINLVRIFLSVIFIIIAVLVITYYMQK